MDTDLELHDLFATLAPWLGIEPPTASPGVDALGPTAPAKPQAYEVAELRIAALRDGPWKLIVSYASGRFELFDLRADPAEQQNLAKRDPRRVAELREKLDRLTARHAPGWHLRGCGCREPARLAFRLARLGRPPTPLNLEPVDRLEPTPDGALVELQLTPGDLVGAERSQGRLPDEDELVVVGAAQPTLLSLRPEAGAAFFVARANGRPVESPQALTLDPASRELRVRPGEPVLCGRPELFLCQPHLRIWYSEPAVQVPAKDVDPELIEQLRALGYQL